MTAPRERRRSDGRAAEDIAARHLEAHGLAIEARNLRTRRGEIDLVARDADALVFVEVRLRRSAGHGGAAASVTARKRARIVAAAEDHLAGLDRVPPCRFDVVVLDALDPARVRWLRGAFDADGAGTADRA